MRHHVPPLPEPLPDTPLPLVEAWLAQARQAMRDATSMTLATVDPDGRPSARMVIRRGFDTTAGWFVFYTDRDSPKGRALEANPRAALVFHWDALERQIRIEGPVTAAPEEDSDRYWNTRSLGARTAAIASDQSRPVKVEITSKRPNSAGRPATRDRAPGRSRCGNPSRCG